MMRLQYIISVILLITILGCKNKAIINSDNFTITKVSSGIVLEQNGKIIGKIVVEDSSYITFLPAADSLKHISINENGVSEIGYYYNGLPYANILAFDKSSLPSKISWYNKGILYSEVTNIGVNQGFIQPIISENIDTNELFMPKVYLTKNTDESYSIDVYSTSYPIYLIGVNYNIMTDELGEYDFLHNSFSLKFDRKLVTSDTLKLGFKFFEDFTSQKNRDVIKTFEYQTKID